MCRSRGGKNASFKTLIVVAAASLNISRATVSDPNYRHEALVEQRRIRQEQRQAELDKLSQHYAEEVKKRHEYRHALDTGSPAAAVNTNSWQSDTSSGSDWPESSFSSSRLTFDQNLPNLQDWSVRSAPIITAASTTNELPSEPETIVEKQARKNLRNYLRENGKLPDNAKRRREARKRSGKPDNVVNTNSAKAGKRNELRARRQKSRGQNKKADTSINYTDVLKDFTHSSVVQEQVQNEKEHHGKGQGHELINELENALKEITDSFPKDHDMMLDEDLANQLRELQNEISQEKPNREDRQHQTETEQLISMAEAYGSKKDSIPEEFAFLTEGNWQVAQSQRRAALAELYQKQEDRLSDPNFFGVDMKDKEDPTKMEDMLQKDQLLLKRSASGFSNNGQSSGRDSRFNKIESMEEIQNIIRAQAADHGGISPSNCHYSDIPDQDEQGDPLNGTFECEGDNCTLRCHTNFAWANSGREYKKIRCAHSTWAPVADFIPRCTDKCPPPEYDLVLPILQETNTTVSPSESLFCNRMGGDICDPETDCEHADQCYIRCPAETEFDIVPHKNTITCDCTGSKCKWVDQGGSRSLRKTSQCVETYGARVIGGYDATRGADSSVMISYGVFGTHSPVPGASAPKSNKRIWQHMCGGVLLNAQWGWTAAHCKQPKLRAIIGEYELNKKDGSEVPCKVLMQIRHPLYDGGTHNDIMLTNIKCKKLVMGDMIKPALLPRPNLEAPAGLECKICGWGNTDYPNYKPADTLQCVNLPIISAQRCNDPYADSIHDDIFCIGEIGVSGKDSCQGDSGGPALCGGIVYGLVMGGLYCAHPDYPGVYTKTSHYIYWAKNVIDATQNRKSLYRRSKRSLLPSREIREIPLDRYAKDHNSATRPLIH